MLRNVRAAAIVLILFALYAAPAPAQLATFDAPNFVKNSLNEIHLYYMQYQQAQALAAQLKQLEAQLKAGLPLDINVWRNAQSYLDQLTRAVGKYDSISVATDNINDQFARHFPGCGSCNQHYGYDQQVRIATMQGIQSALDAAAKSNAQFGSENLSLTTLRNANHHGSQYAAIEAGNQIGAMLVEQIQKERLNQTLLMQAEGAYYINEVQRENDSDQAKSQARALWNYMLHGKVGDPEAVGTPSP